MSVKGDYDYTLVLLLILISVFGFLWILSLKKQVKLKTKQLYQSREDINITLNSIGDAVIATDITGRVTSMNPTAEKLTGWQYKDAKEKSLKDIFNIVNAKTLKKVKNPVDKVLETGNIIGLANHTMLISKQGEKYQIDDSASPIKDSDGMVHGVVLVFRDITKKYQMQEKLRQSQETFSAFINSFPGEAFIKDENFKFVFINNYMKKHRDAEKWMGKDLFEVLPIELAERIIADDKNALKVGSFEAEEQKPDKNGILWDFLTHRFPIVLPNGKKLVGGIAHDFNNILTGLFGNISMAKLTLSKSILPKDHQGFKFLEQAEASMARAHALTRQLITFAKGGAPVKKNVSIDTLVEEVIRFDLSGSDVKPVFHKQPDLWTTKADKAQMQQVFSNITINADQAMPGGGHLYVNLENAEISQNSDLTLSPGKYIKITFRDEGTDINKKHLDHIFDPYFTTKNAGNGLGLATVYSIINRHKGNIIVDTESGHGTIFTIYLPAKESQNQVQAEKNKENRNKEDRNKEDRNKKDRNKKKNDEYKDEKKEKKSCHER